MTRFLGDHPLRVVAKLIVFSLLVGMALTWAEVTPGTLLDRAYWIGLELWNAAMRGLGRFGGTIAMGAMIVVPVFLLGRMVRAR